MDRRSIIQTTACGITAAPFFGLYGCAKDCTNRNLQTLDNKRGDHLDLRPGLTYTELDRNGNSLTDGFFSPGRPDGMGCFADKDNRLVLMRSHEIDRDDHGTSFCPRMPVQARPVPRIQLRTYLLTMATCCLRVCQPCILIFFHRVSFLYQLKMRRNEYGIGAGGSSEGVRTIHGICELHGRKNTADEYRDLYAAIRPGSLSVAPDSFCATYERQLI